MINRISVSAVNISIKLIREQNICYLRACTRSIYSPAALKLSTICNSINSIEHRHVKKSSIVNHFNNFNITQNLLPFVQNRNFCIKKKNSTTISSSSSSNIRGVDENKNSISSQEQSQEIKIDVEDEFPKKISIFAKFKLMYKKYWYVLIPVHLVTSAGWFFSFYLLSKSGVDIPTFLEYLRVSESMIDKVRDSDMGHYAIAYLCYKLATPVRYAVTLGGTTVSIRYLVRLGYIKPVPTKQEVIDKFKKAKDDIKQDLKQRRDTIVEKARNTTSKKSEPPK